VSASEKDPEGSGATDKFTEVLETSGLNATDLSLLLGSGSVPRAGGALAVGIPGLQREASPCLERAVGAGEAPFPGSAGDQATQTRVQAGGKSPGGGGSTVDRLKTDSGLLGRGRGRKTSPDDRRKVLQILHKGIAVGAQARSLPCSWALASPHCSAGADSFG
jgi:hypothetical protein